MVFIGQSDYLNHLELKETLSIGDNVDGFLKNIKDCSLDLLGEI